MRLERHTHEIGVSITTGAATLELVASVEFTATPVIPATGPTYSSGGEQACGGEVEVIKVANLWSPEGFGRDRDFPKWLADWLCENADTTELYDSIDWQRGRKAA